MFYTSTVRKHSVAPPSSSGKKGARFGGGAQKENYAGCYSCGGATKNISIGQLVELLVLQVFGAGYAVCVKYYLGPVAGNKQSPLHGEKGTLNVFWRGSFTCDKMFLITIQNILD